MESAIVGAHSNGSILKKLRERSYLRVYVLVKPVVDHRRAHRGRRMLAKELLIETLGSPAAVLQSHHPVADQTELPLIHCRDHVDMAKSET